MAKQSPPKPKQMDSIENLFDQLIASAPEPLPASYRAMIELTKQSVQSILLSQMQAQGTLDPLEELTISINEADGTLILV